MDKDFDLKVIIFLAAVLIAGAIIYSGNKLSLESELKTCSKALSKPPHHVITESMCMDWMINE